MGGLRATGSHGRMINKEESIIGKATTEMKNYGTYSY